MGRFSRRTALSAVTIGLAAAGVGEAYAQGGRQASVALIHRGVATVPKPSLVRAENAHRGSDAWQIAGKRAAEDVFMGVKGYTSHTSVAPGERLSFHVTVAKREDFGIDVYRVGAYAGAGARLVHSSPRLRGMRQPAAMLDEATGLISCGWEAAWAVAVPENWVSGYYLAVFTTESGWRSYTAFVVRDGRKADLCAIVPFSTYQAYNLWPLDGSNGKSLYYGYDLTAKKAKNGGPPLVFAHRARKVGYDRPFDRTGMPKLADLDQAFARWAEDAGYDVTYATSEDLHAGRIHPADYRGLVFTGHDEYWTLEMRARAEQAINGGTGLAFLSANNAYWRTRYEASEAGTIHRVMACFRNDTDPYGGPGAATLRWRDHGVNPARPEQAFIGVMFNGIVDLPAPLVVREARHWVWRGTGVQDGDRIPGAVRGEADGFDPRSTVAAGDLTLLSASPYRHRPSANGTAVQNTSVLETPSGATVFAAGALTWSRGLYGRGTADHRLRQATANVLDRIISH